MAERGREIWQLKMPSTLANSLSQSLLFRVQNDWIPSCADKRHQPGQEASFSSPPCNESLIPAQRCPAFT